MTLRREPTTSGHYEIAAAECVLAGIEIRRNVHGTPVSVHHCTTCGQEFTVCPPSATFGPDCLSEECDSYDPARDAEVFFAPDDPDLRELP